MTSGGVCEVIRRESGGTVSRIEVRLAPAGEGRTRLELRHIVPDDEHRAQHGPGAVGNSSR